MTLQRFEPANMVETAIHTAQADTGSIHELLPALSGATLYASSRTEVQADGSGFTPLLLGEEAKPLVAVFTAPERGSVHRTRAEYLLGMNGDAFFRRLSPGYGSVVNPGFQSQFVIDAVAVARLRSSAAA